jgi:hypothetical protein
MLAQVIVRIRDEDVQSRDGGTKDEIGIGRRENPMPFGLSPSEIPFDQVVIVEQRPRGPAPGDTSDPGARSRPSRIHEAARNGLLDGIGVGFFQSARDRIH